LSGTAPIRTQRQLARGVEQRIHVRAREHAPVADRLDQFDGRPGYADAEARHACAQRPYPLGGDTLSESPPLKPRVHLFLACRAAELAVNYVPRYTEQPQRRRATTRAIRRCRIDGGEEHFRREVCRQMRIGDASRNQTLHRVDLLAVEHLEYIGIMSDPRHIIGPHISTWYQPAEALHRTPTPNDELLGDPGTEARPPPRIVPIEGRSHASRARHRCDRPATVSLPPARKRRVFASRTPAPPMARHSEGDGAGVRTAGRGRAPSVLCGRGATAVLYAAGRVDRCDRVEVEAL
jgi:hypothetical protein